MIPYNNVLFFPSLVAYICVKSVHFIAYIDILDTKMGYDRNKRFRHAGRKKRSKSRFQHGNTLRKDHVDRQHANTNTATLSNEVAKTQSERAKTSKKCSKRGRPHKKITKKGRSNREICRSHFKMLTYLFFTFFSFLLGSLC